MKRKPFTSYLIAVIGFIALLTLSACERPVRRDDETDTPDVVEPAEETIVIPTAIPTEVPEPDQPAAPETGEAAEPSSEVEAPAVEEPAAEEPAAEQPADQGEAAEPAEAPMTEEGSHTVQAGETLGLIAEKYGLTVEELAAANGITNIHVLSAGQVLVVPVPGTVETETPPADSGEEQTHVVKAGENLFRIGLAYGFTVEELASYNDITDPTRIEVGQIILIPPSN